MQLGDYGESCTRATRSPMRGTPHVTSRNNSTSAPGRPRARRASDWNPTYPALDRQTFVTTDNWLEVLAGNNPHLRNSAGDPKPTTIAVAAGLSYTSLTRVANGEIGLSVETVASLINFLVTHRRYTEDAARKALFRRVTPAAVEVPA